MIRKDDTLGEKIKMSKKFRCKKWKAILGT